MDESDTSHVPDGRVNCIKLSIATPKEIRSSSANDCPITHPSQLMNPFLGLPAESGRCESCGTSEPGRCEGHFGFIELPIPVYHPNHVSELKNILNLICLKCLKLKKGKVRFDLGKERLTDSSSCSRCLDLPPISVREVKISDGVISLELKVPARLRFRDACWNFLRKYGFPFGDKFSRPLLACEALEILKRIPEDTKRKLAGKGHFPQCGYILQSLPVPPNCLLVPDISDGKSVISNDISISLLRKILNKIDLIKKSRSGPPNFDSYEIESNELQVAIAQYLHLRGSKRIPQDVTRKLAMVEASNLSAKQWLEKMRSLFISKGSSFTSRSVLTGDAYKGTEEIGIPSEIAKKMTFEERVTEWNIKYLQELVDSRQCLRYRDGFSTYSTEEGSKGYTSLTIGQVVSRRIMNGDIVFVNRPPTTHKHALQAFSVYIHDDHTIKINPLICAPFGADFDGDCVHIFYPQSLAAKAEVRELFSVQQQLCSSHSGTLNIQFVNDSLLAVKLMCRTSFLRKSTVQQLSMFTPCSLPAPSVIKANGSGPLWTVLQILQTALPSMLDCLSEKILIRNGEIVKLEFSKDSLHLVLSEIAMSILHGKGPKEALKFFNTLQPLLMEILFLEGFSISLEDFHIPKFIMDEVRKGLQEISCLLNQLRLSYNELVDLEVDNRLKVTKASIKDFIVGSSALGNLIDMKSDSSIFKLVQQLGFVGPQLFIRGKLYSRSLVDDIFSHHVKKFIADGVDHPSEAYGLIRSSFFHGLNPYEELIHSISTREVIVRSSRGLAEPGTLFKNLMAVLRDVTICYDGTVRNMCSNSIVQFEYGSASHYAPPGEPVGVLAATAISKPAYAAVLDSSQATNLSWELMKEILLSKVAFKNDVKSRRVMLFLEECSCGKMFCKEKAAILVQNCLKKVTLKECATDFSIWYENRFVLLDGTEMNPCLVGHIHLNKDCLSRMNCTSIGILRKCEEALNHYKKKKSQFSSIFRGVVLSASDECTCSQLCDKISQLPCLQFSLNNDTSGSIVDLDKTIWLMANTIYPNLLDTVIKGDPRVNMVNITWLCPGSTAWVKKSQKACRGELALEVVIEKDAVKQNFDAWRIVLDACLPVMHLIDIKRSVPCGIQQIQSLLGISAAFDGSVQRLSAAVGTVTKGVLKEHLVLISQSMTCTGNFIGFNAAGYKALFHSLNVQVPFTQATLLTPMKCFERAAERCHTDSLSSIVASSLWGKNVSAGTGAHFQIVWNGSQECNGNIGNDVYEFLNMVMPTVGEVRTTTCLGEDIEDLEEENDVPSPEHDALFGNLTFDDTDELCNHLDSNGISDDSSWQKAKSSWEKVPSTAASAGWGSKEDWSRSACKTQSLDIQQGKMLDESLSWETPTASKETIQHAKSPWGQAKPKDSGGGIEGWEKAPSSDTASDGWDTHAGWSRPSATQNPQSQWVKASDECSNWKKSTKFQSNKSSEWEETLDGSSSWETPRVPKGTVQHAKSPWGQATVSSPNSHDLGKPVGQPKDTGGGMRCWEKALSSDAVCDGWGTPGDCSRSSATQNPQSQWEKASEECSSWETSTNSKSNMSSQWGRILDGSSSWETPVASKETVQHAKSPWGQATVLSPNSHEPGKHVNQPKDLGEGMKGWEKVPTDEAVSDGWGTKGDWSRPSTQNPESQWAKVLDEHSCWEKSTNSESAASALMSDDKYRTWDRTATQNMKPSGDQPNFWKEGSGSWNFGAVKPNNEDSPAWGSKHTNGEDQGGQSANPSSWGQTTDARKRSWSLNEKPDGKPDAKRWKTADGWGKRGSGDRHTGNAPKGTRPPIPRRESWSAEEERIRTDVEAIVQSIRRIRTSYNDGDRISEDDQKFILEKVFDHHPDRKTKVTGDIDFIKVDEHKDFPGSRCFFVVSSDGSITDFSYVKCLANFVRKTYQEGGDGFCRKFFARKTNQRADTSRSHGQHGANENADKPGQVDGTPPTDPHTPWSHGRHSAANENLDRPGQVDGNPPTIDPPNQ